MQEFDVIVVGAGICGLTAALDLAEAGKKVLVLEADDLYGGRAKTIYLENDVRFNLGANWFHGGDENPFFQWAKARYDLGPLNEDRAETTRVVIRDGQDDTEAFERNLKLFEEAYEAFRTESEDDISMGALAARTGSPEMKELAEYWATLWMAGLDADSVSARDFFDDPLGVGGWQMQRGLGHLIEQMWLDAEARGVVFYPLTPVDEIVSENGKVVVKTMKDTFFKSAKAIVTVSVGVLKSGMISFDEDVERALKEDLSNIYMGNLFKICLPLDDKFFVDRNIPENFPVAVIDGDKPCFIHARTAGKPSITVFTGGSVGIDMEMWEMDDLRTFACKAIDRSGQFEGFQDHIAGDILPTLWACHGLYLGSYAVHKPGPRKKMDLINCGRVVFAGEGLLSDPKDSPGQMAGAWRAGKKAAALVIDFPN